MLQPQISDLNPTLAAELLRRLRGQQASAVDEAGHTSDASRVAVLNATAHLLGLRASRLETFVRTGWKWA